MTSNATISSRKQNTKQSSTKKGKKGPKWRDASLKLLFSYPEMVSDFLRGFILEELLGKIDFSTLKREPDTFINKHLSERREDRIWSVQTTQGFTIYLYLLFEFQSAKSEVMALRMLDYAAVFLLDLYHRHILQNSEKHAPILPIVIYTGATPWTAPLACSGHCVTTFSSLQRFQPEMEYLLVDIPRMAKESIADEKNLAALLFRLEQCKSPEEVRDEISTAKLRLQGDHYEEFRMVLADWLWNSVVTKFKVQKPTKDNLDLEDVDTMLGENIAKFLENEREDARSEGEEKKSKEIARKMIKEGFGIDIISRLTDISPSDLKKIQA